MDQVRRLVSVLRTPNTGRRMPCSPDAEYRTPDTGYLLLCSPDAGNRTPDAGHRMPRAASSSPAILVKPPSHIESDERSTGSASGGGATPVMLV